MMQLLLRYYQRRPFKTILFFLAFMIGTGGLLIANGIIHSFRDTQETIFSQGRYWVELIVSDPSLSAMAVDLASSIRGSEGVISVERYALSYPLFGVARATLPLYASADADLLASLAGQAGVTLVAGRLPRVAGEAVVPLSFAKSRGLGLGGMVGGFFSQDDAEYGAPAAAEIVGLSEGKAMFALMLDSGRMGHGPLRSTIVFSRDLAALERALQSEAGAGIYVYGPAAYAEQARDRELEYARTASLLAMVVGLAIVLAVVTLDWLDFTLRLPEQVLLQLVGWKRWHLMLRSLLEAVLRGAAGWLCGLLLGFLILQMLRRQVFAPRGMDLLWRRQDLLITMSLPILAAAASLILRLFTTVYDPVFGGKKARQRTMV